MFTYDPSARRALQLVIVTLLVLASTKLSARHEPPQDTTTPCELFGTMPAVFIGEIGAPTRHRMQAAPDAAPIVVTALAVTVERSFRGVAANTVVYLYPLEAAVVSEPTHSGPVAGRRYVIYGAFNFGELKDVVMPVAIKPVEEAADDLAFLGSFDPNSKGGTLYGAIVQGNMLNVADTRTPLPGVTIRFRSGDKVFEAVSDEKGRYSISDLPEGLVKIEPVLPESLAGNRSVEVRAGGCTPQWIVAEFNGRIRGRVLRPDSSPMTWLVSLMPVTPVDGFERQGRSVQADQNGDYEFSVVPPGEYLVGVNLNRPPNNGAPFPPTYYPGTVRRQEAVPVVVGKGTVHERIDIMLADPIRPVKLEVRLQNVEAASSSVVCLLDITSPPSTPGGTYPSPRPGMPIVIDALEGSRYRLMAHVEQPSGHLESEIVEVTVASGHLPVTLSATVPARAHMPGDPCSAFSTRRE
jgi:hypothetical protein